MELDCGRFKRYSRKLIDKWVETVCNYEAMLEVSFNSFEL
jgi:hypothetical protein